MPSEGLYERYINFYKEFLNNSSELLAYRDSLKDYRDYYNTIEFAEIKGRAQGRAEGAQNERIAIALKLKQAGADMALIVQSTGLSEEEIEKL
ncbi:MAG: hypothetical protein IKP73_04585 [Bacteroidales bacterium]|nr:hypothetical protein [Bacteroidales bacterium]